MQTINVQVQGNSNGALNDAKVLMTMQKDEELEWIQDWITYYTKMHSCDSVLIFDNNSTKYGVEDIAKAIQSNSQIETAIIVKWPFKYGPQGGAWVGTQAHWDSDFCQIGAFQTARYRFLSNAAGMINADIDELLVPLSDRTVFEALDESPQGVVGYGGHWISNLPTTSESGTPPRFVDFGFTGGRDDTCSMKWSGQPSKWPTDAHPTAHYVRNIDHLPSADFYIAHFRALNSGWKNTNRLKATDNGDTLKLDLNLINSLNRAFPDSGISKLISSADTNRTNDNHAYQFQNWIRSKLTDLTTPKAQWNKKWLWKSTVPVFEGRTSIGQVAFDCHISERDIKLAVSVRDKQALPDLDLHLKRLSVRIDDFKPKHLGFWTSKAIYNKKRDESWDHAAEHISSQILLIWNELSGSDHYDFTKESPRPIAKIERWPLRNLRDSAEFSELADHISKFIQGRKLLYVPNQGNWGDALIHKGILQFLEFYKFDYHVTSRNEVQSLAKSIGRYSATIDDLVLASGGGGSWRNSNSGNYKFVNSVAPAFDKALVFPHTFEIGKIGSDNTEVAYFARDSTLSRESIPSSIACHDMAFFLQLPFMMEGTKQELTGVFMRNDPEKHPSARSSADGYDLSSMGNHLSSIIPFFQILSHYSHIVTDRMHVAIASAMLGLTVDLYPGNYGKSNAVFAHTLSKHYPSVTLRRW